MISFFSKWAQGIIVAIIITVIIEMILPEGNNKKYIKMVLGIYVLYTILNPILLKFSDGISINNILVDEYIVEQNTIEAVAINTNATIEAVYTKNITNEIKTYLSTQGFNVSNINATIETEDEITYGMIKELELTISKKDEADISIVEPISINVGEGEEKIKYTSVIESIKVYLNNNYGIDKDKIIIKSE